MALIRTLARADADLAAGRIPMARQRLRGLVASYPTDPAPRRALAEVYRLYDDPAEAGRWMYLEEDRDEAETAAFEARYEDPARRMRALAWAGPESLAGSAVAAERLAAVRAACSAAVGRPVEWGAVPRTGDRVYDNGAQPAGPLLRFMEDAGCFLLVCVLVGIWLVGLVSLIRLLGIFG
ncbi:DUF6584 family protein [Streptomyces paludis]|uniref:Uncharacterized protein n=1 Tax=Streptomyces paludis TaxID=2282738 RepID=A0A345HUK6_9ACTN|nr:DUF6584 family protein [Streptomyces paludis]AXG80380.1 hypothetical protein DVK44_24970 [Streptomyces paludis]